MKPKSETGEFIWVGTCLGFFCSLIIAATALNPVYHPLVTVVMVTLMGSLAGLILYFPAKMIYLISLSRGRERMDRAERIKRYKKLVRKRIKVLEAKQLTKPDYESRLATYVANAKVRTGLGDHEALDVDLELSDTVATDEETYEEALEPDSSMPYWQLNKHHVGKMPMPVDMIRMLIRRISIAVYKGSVREKPQKSI